MDYLSEELLPSLIEKHLGYGFEIGGTINPSSFQDLLIEFMGLWVSGIDKDIADEYNSKGFSKKYIRLFKRRGFTFEEYSVLFQRHDFEEWDRYPVFEYLQIENEYSYGDNLGRQYFISKYTNDKEGYVSLLLDQRLDCLEAFFRRVKPRIPKWVLKYSHNYILAKSGEGKSELMKVLIHMNLKYKKKNESIVVIDPHAKLANELFNLKWCQENIEKVVYIDPKLGYPFRHPVINPFDIGEPNSEVVNDLSRMYYNSFIDVLGTKLTDGMKTLLNYSIPVVLWKEDGNVYDLLKIMKNDPEMIQLGQNNPDRMVSEFYRDRFEKDIHPSTKNGLLFRLEALLRDELIRKTMIGRTTFDLEQLMNSGKFILINLESPQNQDAAKILGRLIISQIKMIGAKRTKHQLEKMRVSTKIYIDEFEQLISGAVTTMLPQMRKFGIFLCLAHQNTEQINNELVAGIMTNINLVAVGKSFHSSIKSIVPNMMIKSDDVMKLKRYHFWLKAGDNNAFQMKGPSYLINSKTNPFYVHEKHELDEMNQFMLERYYGKSESIKEQSEIKTPELKDWDIPDDITY